MAGLGYRREMLDWDISQLHADFFEVAPENWIRRDKNPLYQLRASGRPVQLHGVSLNLGGSGEFDLGFLQGVRSLMDELEIEHYSDHLAASGDAHQLYDLLPIPFTQAEALRVANRIQQVQDLLGRQIAIENTTWYTNIGEMDEIDFLLEVVSRTGCNILLDINNIAVNHKNHGGMSVSEFIARIPHDRISYLHVAGHEFDERFGLYVDTHSQPVEPSTRALALQLSHDANVPVLLEWDNDLPDMATLNQELACLRSTTM